VSEQVQNVHVTPVSWLLMDPPVPAPDVMTELQAAAFLGLWKRVSDPAEQEKINRRCLGTMRTLVASGELAPSIIAGRRCYLRERLLDMVRRRERTPGWRERLKEYKAQAIADKKKHGRRKNRDLFVRKADPVQGCDADFRAMPEDGGKS
jgi:hypothetical protein